MSESILHRFQLAILVQSFNTKSSAIAGFLVTTERCFMVCVATIDGTLSRPNSPGDGCRFFFVACPYSRGQAIGRVVCDFNGLIQAPPTGRRYKIYRTFS